MADATELSSACPLAAAAGKTPGKAQQAASRLQAVADHGACQQFSNWHPAAIA